MKEWTPDDIKTLRDKKGLSQEAFGRLLGVTRNYVYYLEKGVKRQSKTLRLLLDCIQEKLKKERR